MKNKFLRANNVGLTLVELAVVVGVLATLLGLTTISLTNIQQKSSISTTIDTIISDMKEQQIKAMIGDTEGRPSVSPYGVHFDGNQYVLFNGSTYSSSDATNFVVPFPQNVECTTPTDIIFAQTSGELIAPASITIRNETGSEEKTIQLNRYGVITMVN